MERLLLCITLSIAAVFVSAETGAAPPAATGSAPQKVIKDAAEYNAYIGALNTKGPAARGAALEAFVALYPGSVMREDALAQAMAAYQQAGDQAKLEQAATQLLQADPRNLQALSVVVVLKRARATQGDRQALADLPAETQQGLSLLPHWPRPAGISAEDYAKLQRQMEQILEGAAGFAALQAKDYAQARAHYRKSVAIDPGNLQDVYQLAIAELEMSPLDPDGFWYIAKANAIAATGNNAAAQQNILAYGKGRYHRYHGSEDGWDRVLAAANGTDAPPAGFAQGIKPAPTPADLAVQAVQQNDPASLSFSDREFILGFRDASPANRQAADKVWKSLLALQKGGKARLEIPVMVIAVNGSSLDAAISDDNQTAKKSDLHVKLLKAADPAPAPGSLIKVIGVLRSYQPKPFLFIMDQGEVATEPTPAVATH